MGVMASKTATSVRAQIYTCTNCELAEGCRSPVPMSASRYLSNLAEGKYVVVGEAPGKWDDHEGQPFVGPAGAFLRRELRRAGLRFTDGVFMNAVCCWPKSTRTPTADHQRKCSNNLFDQLAVTAPVHVLVCGNVALTSLLPHGQISYMAGVAIHAHGKVLYPIYHPSYVLRERMVYDVWARQLYDFGRLVAGKPIDRPVHCIYCDRGVMTGEITCHVHEKLLRQDRVRVPFKPPPAPEPTLF